MRTHEVRAGTVITELALGTAQLGDLFVPLSQGIADEVVAAAWDEGIRYFDTAPHYGVGLAERRLGSALAGYARERYVVSTKVGRLIVERDGVGERVWDFSGSGVRRSLEESGDRLALSSIDIALVHDPGEHLDAALDEAYPALDELRRSGTIGAIGVGTRDLESLIRFARDTDVDVLMVAGRMTPLDSAALDEVIPLCRATGKSIIVAGVFNSGVLAAPNGRFEYGDASPEIAHRAKQIEEVALRHGATLAEAALAYGMAAGPVSSVVVGAESAEQIRDTAARYRRARELDLSAAWNELVEKRIVERHPRAD